MTCVFLAILLLPSTQRALQLGDSKRRPLNQTSSLGDGFTQGGDDVHAQAAAFAQDRFGATSGFYHHAASIGADLPNGHWQQDFTFKTTAALNLGGSLKDNLGHKKIFIVGDSWGREKYTTLVRLLANENGVALMEHKYSAPPGQMERRDLNELRHAEPAKWQMPECKYEACPGINLSRCGLPGGDQWASPSGATVHYRFKTYFRTEPADEALMSEIVSVRPDLIFLDIGRWGPSPNACTQANRTSFQELSSFLLALNATTTRPVFLWQSGGESHYVGGDRNTSHTEPFDWTHYRDLIERCRFLEIPVDHMLNDNTLRMADCSKDPQHGWGQPMGLNEYRGSNSTSCPSLHGFAGTFLDEAVRLSAQYVKAVVG